MTTISTICGALPLALAFGRGAEAREQIGWIVVGGMAFGTFLTLFVLPIVYIELLGSRDLQLSVHFFWLCVTYPPQVSSLGGLMM